MLLGICDVYENRHRKGCTYLMGVITLMGLRGNSKILYVKERRGPGVCVLRQWCPVCLPAHVTKETQLYRISL
jgi:hypothetical protein